MYLAKNREIQGVVTLKLKCRALKVKVRVEKD